jgi:hypothetical protein
MVSMLTLQNGSMGCALAAGIEMKNKLPAIELFW